jgi:alpha-1,3-glucan synthase
MLQDAVVYSFIFILSSAIHAMRYDPAYAQWNLNTAVNAVDPLDYSGVWENHTFNPSPENWRFPFYTVMLDKFVNGDPTNDNANGTIFEHDLDETQLRHGGDIRGLKDSLDYIQGMGIKVSNTLILTEFRQFIVLAQFS